MEGSGRLALRKLETREGIVERLRSRPIRELLTSRWPASRAESFARPGSQIRRLLGRNVNKSGRKVVSLAMRGVQKLQRDTLATMVLTVSKSGDF